MSSQLSPQQVLEFWRSVGPKGWWTKDEAVDLEIKEKFGSLHERAASGNLDGWADSADGALALVVLLDQFSRNLFRGSARAFETDSLAKQYAEQAISNGFDQQVDDDLRPFFYLPFMHSETIGDQEKCVIHMHAIASEGSLKAAIEHRKIIRNFGRFPHRNEVMGRHTTSAEQAYLDDGGFKG